MTADQRVEPSWLDKVDAVAIHDRQLAEHGGGRGVRDVRLLESALARPVNRCVYGEADPATLAAAYVFGVARNQPFVDGNKRTAWVLSRLFLALNGHELRFNAEGTISMMLNLASGALSEESVAEWFGSRLVVT